MPLVPISLDYRAGLTNDICPYCRRPLTDNNAIQVTPETVIGIVDEWMTDSCGRRTERIAIVYVEINGTAPPKEPLTEPKAGQP